MKLQSPAFEHHRIIPSQYTCDGENINPPLQISDVPKGAKSLVLLMDDPDVPVSVRADGMWDHWVVFNIPPDVREIKEGDTPPGILGVGTGGNARYQGPCPPDREHRYFFKLFAVDIELSLKEGAVKADVEQAMEGHVVSQAELIGLYERS